MAHIVGLRNRLCAAAGGCEVGAGVEGLAAVAAAAKQAAAAACVLHLVLLPSVYLHVHQGKFVGDMTVYQAMWGWPARRLH